MRRTILASFLRPGTETAGGQARIEPCLAYLVVHPQGQVLFDTGMGSDPEVDARYHPTRVSLKSALAAAGSRLDEVRMVANCHLHFDHCGGNPEFPGTPIFVQRAELEAARTTEGYTLPNLIDLPGLTHQALDGEAEILPGVRLIPTPGHSPGHQSLVVSRDDGTLVVAGQSHEDASSFAADALAWRAPPDGAAGLLDPLPEWLSRLMRLDPRRVVFAHDHSVWEP